MLTRRLNAPKALAALAGVGLILGVATPAAAVTPPQQQTTLSCSYSSKAASSNSWGYARYEYAGHYSGLTAVPSTTQVTTAGEEAQCLLKLIGQDPGPIDGVFGSQSQAAMRSFQVGFNQSGYGQPPYLDTDGMPGPQSWPALRGYASLF